ncbi:MAG TPA: TetR/AcrR family transcriptional regulator [Epsilonproteobacteria bacterium]|nr:TetR/AcrR family transcriptional regulator [Campylobacterota bacterium]
MTNKITTRGRPKAFDEQEALTVAMHYFWEHGYDNTSLDNLLLAMGIKKSSFYATFKSKEEVFSRCLVLYREDSYKQLQALKAQVGPKEAMLMLTHITIKELEETGNVKGCLLINSGKECYNRYTVLSQQIKIEFNFVQDLFVEFVKEAQELGEIKSKKDAHVISGRYMNTLNGLVVTIQAGATQALIDDLVESLKEILE